MSGKLSQASGWFWPREPRFRAQRNPEVPRILVIRRNRMGDMICTLPLLQALRRHYPQAYLAVACDAPGQPIADACDAVDGTILLLPGGLRPFSMWRNARRIQGFDWVIAAKGGYDRRLAKLTRRSRGALRVGFAPKAGDRVREYTDSVAPPPDRREHQVETLLRLMEPFGVARVNPLPGQMKLDVPAVAKEFARQALSTPELTGRGGVVLINISSTSRLRFREEDFLELASAVVATGRWSVAFVFAPKDESAARSLAARAGVRHVAVLPTPTSMDLAALLERAVLLVTPEGGAAHLAATVGTPAVVLWSEGPFDKWRSRGERHVFVQAKRRGRGISVERVWAAVDGILRAIV